MKTFRQFILEVQDNEESERRAFFNRVYKAARAAGDKFPEIVASQAALESGWGKSPSGKYNYFGQKASADEKGTVKGTQEFGGGGYYGTSAKFKDFESPEEGIKNRVQRWGGHYADLDPNKDSVETAVSRLLTPGGQSLGKTGKTSFGVYATDPDYVSKVSDIAKRYRDQAKSESDRDTTTTVKPDAVKPSKPQEVVTTKNIKGDIQKVTTNKEYDAKLGGLKSTVAYGKDTRTVTTQLKPDKATNFISSLLKPKEGSKQAAVLGGKKGTVTIGKGGERTFTSTEKIA